MAQTDQIKIQKRNKHECTPEKNLEATTKSKCWWIILLFFWVFSYKIKRLKNQSPSSRRWRFNKNCNFYFIFLFSTCLLSRTCQLRVRSVLVLLFLVLVIIFYRGMFVNMFFKLKCVKYMYVCTSAWRY